LRRLVVIATALAVLAAAASAFAATGGLNSYTGSTLKFSPNKAGSGAAPTAIGFTENYVANGTNGNRTAPLTDIKTTVYGVKSDGKDFPTCSLAKIGNAKSDAGCPKGALIATGSITAQLGPAEASEQSTAIPTVPCTPLLHVWNAGQGKVVFFFVVTGSHTCGPIQTGSITPFAGTAKAVGKNLVLNTPIPNSVSFPITGVEGSLTGETLHYLKVSKTVKGKTVMYQASVACKNGKRPYSVAFTAENGPGGAPSTQTVTGTQKCAK
jgi:hypothetical protein